LHPLLIFIKKLVVIFFITEPNGGGISSQDLIELELKEKKIRLPLLARIEMLLPLIMNS
jgi:hypothetical protein